MKARGAKPGGRLAALRVLIALFAAASCSWAAAQVSALPALNIDIAQTTVSGISSGGFMSVQFEIAHSNIVRGAGIVAAGPYYCAQGDVVKATTQCSCTGEPALPCAVTSTSAEVPALVAATKRLFEAGLLADPANVAHHKVVTVAGRRDPLVPPAIATQLADYYKALGMPSGQISEVVLNDAGHTMPTRSFGTACSVTAEPYIGRCEFDGAGAILGGLYGALQPARAGKPKGRYIQFDQRPFVPSDGAYSFLWGSGLDSSGWVYVPPACDKGQACRLHVVLHGCKQGQSYLPLKPPPGGGLYYGTTFVKNAGYARWADTNRLVLLFPQAVSIPLKNPNGCWDWWGYTDDHYADRKGVQMRALRAMVDKLASGAPH